MERLSTFLYDVGPRRLLRMCVWLTVVLLLAPTSLSAEPLSVLGISNGRAYHPARSGDSPTAHLHGAPADTGFTEYPLPTANSGPYFITAGPDGALWFTSGNNHKIGRISTAGFITEYQIPTAGTDEGITVGSDGALWFTEYDGYKIGRITTTGQITEYPLATYPNDITAGPDGALWFTERFANNIGRITTAGQVIEYSLPQADSEPSGITAGPDGAVWFTEYREQKIGRISTAGQITEYPFPVPSNGHDTGAITAGPDGALWFGDTSRIGRITTTGVITEYTLPTGSYIGSLTAGPDGAVWFADVGANKIGRITVAGQITEYSIPTANISAYGITAGPDGALWFTEYYANKIGRYGLSLEMSVIPDANAVPATGLVTATVAITNTGAQPTSAVTLTLTEGEGSLYAYYNQPDSGRFGTVAGLSNTIYFDAGPFQAGEQKTFHIPFIISPNPDGNQTTTSIFTATNASGIWAASPFQVTATPLSEPAPDSDALDRLTVLPVADLGPNPDAPFAGAPSLAAARGPTDFLYPSDYGDWWQYYVTQSIDRWGTTERIMYYTLKKAGMSTRDAYAAIYLKALIGMRLPNLNKCGVTPSKLSLAKASAKFWWALQQAKWRHNTDGFAQAFKAAVGALDKCHAGFITKALEIADKYSGPMVSAMQDAFAAFNSNDAYFQQEMDAYVKEGTPLATTPFPKLVQADLDYWLTHRSYYTKLHGALRTVDIKVAGGGTTTLGLAIEKYLQYQANIITYMGTPPDPRFYGARNTSLQLHSPLLPVVTDMQGRRSGVDAATGMFYDEIPHVFIVAGHPWELSLPVSTTQQLTVSWGTAYPANWNLDVEGIYSGTVTSQQSFQGFAGPDFSNTQTLSVTVGASSVQVQASFLGGGFSSFLPLLQR